MKTKILLLSLLFPFFGGSQTLLKLQSAQRTIPETVFLAGDFNNWHPADSNYLFKDGQLHLDLPQKSIEAKLTGGSWQLAEASADGRARPNRKLELKGDTLTLIWEAWESHVDRPPRGVSLLSDSSLRLNGAPRKVWIYLPPDYHQSDYRYPVLYLHDAQNLFEGLSGSPEKWQVAQCLDRLQLPLILVGIEHGGKERINELSPFINKEYRSGGGAESYLQFIEQRVIPFVDHHYRSLSDPNFRFIGGSSLGGLVSYWALISRPEYYGGALIFSPAYWFNPDIFNHPSFESAPKLVYQMVGDQEGGEPEVMVKDLLESDRVLAQKFPHWPRHYKVVAGGQHNEELWQQELEEALLWFFDQAPLNEYRSDVRKHD